LFWYIDSIQLAGVSGSQVQIGPEVYNPLASFSTSVSFVDTTVVLDITVVLNVN